MQLIATLATGNKLAISEMAGDIMPQGKPDFKNMTGYPSIRYLLLENGTESCWRAIAAMLHYFVSNYNLRFNMDKDQIAVCAKALVDDCGNYRMEDYFTMFELVRQNKLVKIYDRLDQQMIFSIKEEYDDLRFREGQKILEEKDNERQRLIEIDRLNRLESSTVVDIDFGVLYAELKKAKERSYNSGLELKKKKIEDLKEMYASTHKINVSQIPRTFKTEPDQQDLDFINNCFTPKKNKK